MERMGPTDNWSMIGLPTRVQIPKTAGPCLKELLKLNNFRQAWTPTDDAEILMQQQPWAPSELEKKMREIGYTGWTVEGLGQAKAEKDRIVRFHEIIGSNTFRVKGADYVRCPSCVSYYPLFDLVSSFGDLGGGSCRDCQAKQDFGLPIQEKRHCFTCNQNKLKERFSQHFQNKLGGRCLQCDTGKKDV